ncbi:MAG: DinB family protein [Gemmatimonadetes bacterium]|nr:DinB family protein [Gemmatimonadota bacterium]
MADSADLSLDALLAAPLPVDAPDHARRLTEAVGRAAPALLRIAREASSSRPAPGKWSPREIIGHLIDSASNNHQRFVRMSARDDLVVEGYEQDWWVASQRYQESPWPELVVLWLTYNRHLARVMCATSSADRARIRPVHNLDERAFRPVSRDRAVTLEYFMSDYVDHLEHHLAQVLG